jgi:hypothetical protein
MSDIVDLITFEVDFNDRNKDGRLLASMRFASGAVFPRPGERVWTYDDEGNGCEGTVYSVDGLIVTITLDRSTWARNRAVVSNPFQPAVAHPKHNTTGVDPDRVPEFVG